MKKLVIRTMTMGLLIVALASCAAGQKYQDVEQVLDRMTLGFDTFTAALTEADTSEEVVTSIDALVVELEAYGKDYESMISNYPEFADMENPPEELADNFEKLMVASSNMSTAMEKIYQYAEDEAVNEALMRMMAANQ